MITLLAAALAIAGASPAYTMAVTIAPDAMRLEGRATIRWRNQTPQPVSEIQLLCDYNTQPNGSMTLTGVREASSDRDLLANARAVAVGASRPSAIAISLPSALEPDGEIALDVQWTATLPDAAARGGVVLAAHWFPQLAVLSSDGWIVHRDASRSFVFADASAFDVTIDAPAGWSVVATGREERAGESIRGRRFVQADASDFAFAVGRGWIERQTRVERTGGDPIELRLALQPEHAGHADRILADVATALARADSAIAPYPYATLTILDLPWRSAADGDVFPSFVTVTTRWMAPRRVVELERAIARSIAAHAWHAVVPADAVAHPWLVDGVSAYAAQRLTEPLVQRQLESTSPAPFLTARFFGGFVPYAIRAIRASTTRPGEPPATVRATRALQTLERYVGWPTFETILSEYGRQFRFSHPAPRDFERVAESVSGRELKWLFDEAFDPSRRFDYAIARVDAEAAPSPRYRTTVTAARLGDGVFSGSSRAPIAGFQSGRAMEIATTFADGTTLRDAWDGRARTITFGYESAAPVASVAIDPDRVLVLDEHRTNNSWTAQPHRQSTALRWSAQWMTWLQHLLLTYGLLV